MRKGEPAAGENEEVRPSHGHHQLRNVELKLYALTVEKCISKESPEILLFLLQLWYIMYIAPEDAVVTP